MSESQYYHDFVVSEFRGNFPDVPFAPGVNIAELKEVDTDPMFVTLPIIPQVGAVSRNGLLYDEALVDSIAEQINDKRPGAGMGHIKPEDRDSSFPYPDGFWVGARRVDNALWGKAYIPPGKARDMMRTLKAVGGRIATSIYGKGQQEVTPGGARRMKAFNLESLDFGAPERAALGNGAMPIITAEMTTDNENKGEDDMPTKAEIIAELTTKDIPQTLRDQLAAEWQADNQQTSTIAELTQQVSDRDTVITELRKEIEQVRIAEFEAAVDGVVAEFVKMEPKDDAGKEKVAALQRMFRAQVVAEMGSERDKKTLKDKAQKIWDEQFKVIAETVRDALAGPSAFVSGKGRAANGYRKIEDTPEARAAARAKLGI